MNIYRNAGILIILCTIFLTSCVSSKKHKALEWDYVELKGQYDNLEIKSNEMAANISRLEREKKELQAEADKIPGMQDNINLLQKQLKEMENLQLKFKNDNQQEIAELYRQLQKEKEGLLKKEDELRERNRNLNEMKAALARKDSVAKALRSKVADALLGFEGKGLAINQKDGKVYVSMDEKLLFKSGRYDIEPAGVKALKQLAKVLEQNADINIMVEGHTDNVAYQGSGNLQDNWDLSVKRATTVVRTLLQGSTIDPVRIIAAGHGEFIPVDINTTAEGRQKNRRTEVILSPKIDELLKIIGTN